MSSHIETIQEYYDLTGRQGYTWIDHTTAG